MTKVTELAIRTKAAVLYPGWRVDFVGPATIALTHVMGRERVIEVRHRRRGDEHPLMTAARWIIIATFWMFGMVVAATVVMAVAMGIKF